jgi:hypothetical protein
MIIDGIAEALEEENQNLLIKKRDELAAKLDAKFTRVNVLDDGNCLFHAIAAQAIPEAKELYRQGPQPHSKQQEYQQAIRDLLVEKMEAEGSSPKEIDRVGTAANDQNLNVNKSVEKGAHWGNENDCEMLAEIFGRPIHFYAPGYAELKEGCKIYCHQESDKEYPPIYLFTDGALHWEFLVPKLDKGTPPDIST